MAQQKSVVTFRPQAEKPAISKYIYSHFAEHLGRCIYGGFYVGENSPIPNTAGIRNDIIAALKKMKIPALRWPGGCFADTYHWKDGIGPKAQRPSMVNRWWGGVTEDNRFGTHDFLNMCEVLETEPYLAGNIGSGTVQELADWVQYVHSDTKNPMSDLRKKNGRDKPCSVRYWGVGNEAWGCGGNMTPEYYANEFKKYATFMSEWTSKGKIQRIASGANSADYNWTETLMKLIPVNMLEGVALHHYAVIEWNKKGSDDRFNEDTYFKSMQAALKMEELVTRHSAIMDKYDPQKKVALVVDEWGGWYDVADGTNPGFLYQQNTMRDAMIAGVTLNIFNNHADRVRMAALAQTVNVLQAVILTDKEKMILTPTYHVLEMYKVHQDATLLPLTIKTSDYTVGTERLPAVSISASVDTQKSVHITLTNIDSKQVNEVEIPLDGFTYKKVTGRILTSGNLQDKNTFDDPNKIKPSVFTGTKLQGGKLLVTLPPISVVVLNLD
ncbi:MAG: alpha-N-arabinofuranosidase [Mucilaginibacter sp.]|nr:alpha-N-arabinofuranosidase [Mucilaginibacter sp.]